MGLIRASSSGERSHEIIGLELDVGVALLSQLIDGVLGADRLHALEGALPLWVDRAHKVVLQRRVRCCNIGHGLFATKNGLRLKRLRAASGCVALSNQTSGSHSKPCQLANILELFH